jgi:hypothetical protein
LAKKGANDNSQQAINPRNIKNNVLELGSSDKNLKVQKLKGKLINISADLATCLGRSFIGKIFKISISNYTCFNHTFCAGINVQYFDRESQNVVLQNLCCSVKFEHHFACNIESWIRELLGEYKIEDKNILSFSIDSGANITKAIDDFIDKYDKSTSKAMEENFDADKISSSEIQNDDTVNDADEAAERVYLEIDGEKLDITFENGEISYGNITMLGSPVRIHCVCQLRFGKQTNE